MSIARPHSNVLTETIVLFCEILIPCNMSIIDSFKMSYTFISNFPIFIFNTVIVVCIVYLILVVIFRFAVFQPALVEFWRVSVYVSMICSCLGFGGVIKLPRFDVVHLQ